MSMFMVVTHESHIDEYVVHLHQAVHQGVQQGAQLVSMLAQETVPVETGSLHDTIDNEQLEDAGEVVQWSVNAGDMGGGYKGGGMTGKAAGTPVDYAEAQEYGGGTAAHTPFMTPASEMGWLEYQNLMADLISGIAL